MVQRAAAIAQGCIRESNTNVVHYWTVSVRITPLYGEEKSYVTLII